MPVAESSSVSWLVLGDTVLASLEVADTHRARARGLLGRDSSSGALLLRPARSVHTIGMRFAIDVAHVDDEFRVLRLTTMVPNRLGRPVLRAAAIVEAPAGAFARWGVLVGDQLEAR